MNNLRQNLVEVALEWERCFGNIPHITTAISEFDAAQLIGMTLEEYSDCMRESTAVQKGFDFVCKGLRYQVKANRPSGKKGSFVTWVPKPSNFEWDCLIWILYDSKFVKQEAWLWDVLTYRKEFELINRLSPKHYKNPEIAVDLLRCLKHLNDL